MEAVLWLVPLGPGNNRAFMASGCAAAAAAKGLHVTLLEIGRGLPNIGYYFSLDPHEYAAASADPSRLVTGSSGTSLQFISCTRTKSLDLYEPRRITVDSPHLLVIAFDEKTEHGVIEDIGRRWMPDHGGNPDALCAFGGPDAGIERRALFDTMRKRHREAFLLDLVNGCETEKGAEADETFSIPEHLVSSWCKRALPEDTFFDDVVSNVLQVLSHRRRRAEGHASG